MLLLKFFNTIPVPVQFACFTYLVKQTFVNYLINLKKTPSEGC